jgi:hypothetical protein
MIGFKIGGNIAKVLQNCHFRKFLRIISFAILSGAKCLRQRSEIMNLHLAALGSGYQKAYYELFKKEKG